MGYSIIIVSLNGRERIHLPLEALARGTPRADEVIVVDNGGSDGLAGFVRREYPWVRVVRARRNLGFAGGNNLGLLNAHGEVLVLLNDDTEPDPTWLAELESAFVNHPRMGVLGCQLLYPGGEKVQHLGGWIQANGLTDHEKWGEGVLEEDTAGAALACDYATGAALAVRREVIGRVGLLDTGFWPIYFEEVDFCERARRAGWEIGVAPRSRVIHHESQTTGRMSARFLRLYHRNRVRFLIKNRAPHEWPAMIRAEARWMARHAPWDSLWPCALAYAWAPFQIADLLRQEWLDAS